MEEKKLSIITGDEIRDLSNKVYEDAAHPILHEIGEVGNAVLRFVSLPFKFLGMTAEQLEIKYADFIKRTIGKVPEDKITIPNGVIISPLLEHVKYVFDEQGLSEMFSTLLANAMNRNVDKLVHPAFVDMLKQMSPLDAEFLNVFFRDEDVIEFDELSWERGEFQRELTIDSLSRLGIIEKVTYDGRHIDVIQLTTFGRLFRNLCMIEPTEVSYNDCILENDDDIEEEDGIIPSEIGIKFEDSLGTELVDREEGDPKYLASPDLKELIKGGKTVLILRISNIEEHPITINSAYIECEGRKHIITDTNLPVKLNGKRYLDLVFSKTSKNELLKEAIKEKTVYIVQIGEKIYEFPITNRTKKEIVLFIKNQ